jgi:hypothetical protein
LKAFWKVISPVPVNLKRFFALLLVFTFGMLNNQLRLHPAGVPTQVGNLLSHTGNSPIFSEGKAMKKYDQNTKKSEGIRVNNEEWKKKGV